MRTLILLLLGPLAALLSIPASAQTALSALSGTIRTETNSGITNARISIQNTADGHATVVMSNGDGSYRANNLSPGTYVVSVSAPGFTQAQATVMIAGAQSIADFRLVVEQTKEAAETQHDTSSDNQPSDAINSKTIGELPLNGRSSSDVAALEPGVFKARTQAQGDGRYGYGTQMVIFGGRPRQNNSRLDGVSVNDYANGPLGNAVGIALGVDALEQLSVLTSNDQAQYGRSSGGYISSSTHAGSSRFHGSVFEYLRNDALDAANYFDRQKPPFRRNQFGASAGGPIRRDDTFFFADYEGIRQSQGVTNVSAVPSAAARAGNLSTGVIAVDPEVLRFLAAFYPLPNAGLLGAGDTGIYISSGQKVTPGNHFTTRIDHPFSSKDSLWGTYMFDSGNVLGPDKLGNKLAGYDSRQQLFTFNETHTFSPRLLHSFRFGIYRMVANSGQTALENNPLVGDSSFGAVPGHDVPRIDVTGLTSLDGGLDATSVTHFHWTSIQAYDDIAIRRGAHSFTFGVSFERMRDNIIATTDPAGRFGFNSLSDFLTNRPFSLGVTIPGPLPERGFRQTVAGAYFQDEWRWRPRLIWTLGLRYEMATVPSEVHGRVSVLRNLTDAQPLLGTPLFANPTVRNFEPRVGFAWDPRGDAKTIVSSGFGIFDVLPLPYVIQFGEIYAAPFLQTTSATKLPAGSFPTEAFAITAASSNFSRQDYIEPKPHRNYVMQWNFTIRRELPLGLSMKLGYVGSRGVHHIFRLKDADIVLPALAPQGYLWPSPAGSGTRLNPNVGRINGTFWEGDSFYDALVLQLKEKVGRSFQITGSYTWGKSIDTGSSSIEGDEYSNAVSSPLWFDTRLNRGLSDFNVAQELKVIYSWEIRGPKWPNEVMTRALSGWQAGGIFEASTALPFTPGIGGDPLGVNSSDPGVDVPNVITGSGCESPINRGDPIHYIKTQCFALPNPITLRGNLGRNTLIGPGLVNFDFSVFKNNYIRSISDLFNAQFRAEFFNIMNRPNFNAPLTNRFLFDSHGKAVGSAGLVDSTQTPSRQIQFALKFIW